MPFLKELGANRLYPIFVQVFYVVIIFVTVVAGGGFLIDKIKNLNSLLATETEKYQANTEKLKYLNTFPYDTNNLLGKMNYVFPSGEVSFLAVSTLKAKAEGDVILSDLSVGNDQKGQVSLSVDMAGSPASVISFVSQVLEGYPLCDFSSLKYSPSSGIYNLNLAFYQRIFDQKEMVFAKVTPNDETLIKEILGVSTTGSGEITSPSVYSRDNPF